MTIETTPALAVGLADFVANTRFEDLPPRIVERMRVYLLDTLAAGFVGSGLPWTRMVEEMVSQEGGREACSLFGASSRVSPLQAALINGVMVGGYEAEHVGHEAHPAGTVVPAALALAEDEHLSGREFLTATTLAYEVVCRIGAGQTGAVEAVRGFHNPAVNGPFGAAAAAGKLLGLDPEGLVRALGIAGSYSSGLTEFAFDGSMTKRLHLGHASRGGLEAALLAQQGFTGPKTVLEGRYGYFNAFSPSPKPERVLADLGDVWLLETLSIKAYPCHMVSQAVVSAIQSFKKRQAIDPLRIAAVEISGHPDYILRSRFLDRTPNSEMGAQYSVPFTVAVALVRDLDDPLQFDESVLSDPDIARLSATVTWEPLEGHPLEYSQVRITTTDGESCLIEAVPYRGSLTDPASYEDVTDKFIRFSRHVLSGERQSHIVNAVSMLDDISDMAEVAQMFRPGARIGVGVAQ